MHPAPSIRAAESSETKYTENLGTKELLKQRRQFALPYRKVHRFSQLRAKKKSRQLGRNASRKKSIRDMENRSKNGVSLICGTTDNGTAEPVERAEPNKNHLF